MGDGSAQGDESLARCHLSTNVREAKLCKEIQMHPEHVGWGRDSCGEQRGIRLHGGQETLEIMLPDVDFGVEQAELEVAFRATGDELLCSKQLVRIEHGTRVAW